MDREFHRELIKWVAETPAARELVHEIVRKVGEMTVRGRKPSDKEVDALAAYLEARAEADAAAAKTADAEAA